MKRWNGWGESSVNYPLLTSAVSYLEARLGTLTPYPDASLSDVLESVPPSRLKDHAMIERSAEARLRHARGQSLPDWIALRSGRIPVFPDGVAYPSSSEEVQSLLDQFHGSGVHLIPYGGGTSVVGHINPLPGKIPILTIDLGRMNRLISLDSSSRLATFEAGVHGPDLEKQLSQQGYTLGHFPQSFQGSTLGGWIATRSSGQQSLYYGRIEDLFAGGRVATPKGTIAIPPLPASAAGPNLRHLILGSEGRMGIITQATLRVRPLPNVNSFYGVFFKDWESGATAVQDVVQSDVPLSMLRLSDSLETETTLMLSGKESLVTLADWGLRTLGYESGRCLLIYGVTSDSRAHRGMRRSAQAIFRRYGGLATGKVIGEIWRKNRFHTAYLRNTLWEKGVAVDTLETAVPWSQVLTTAHRIKSSIREAFQKKGHRALVFAHLSHVYRDGASIYITFLFPRTADPDELLHRWQRAKSAASQMIVNLGGTISHQHGVGLDHLPYLSAEKSPVGMDLIIAASKVLDPERILNPGKLFGD